MPSVWFDTIDWRVYVSVFEDDPDMLTIQAPYLDDLEDFIGKPTLEKYPPRPPHEYCPNFKSVVPRRKVEEAMIRFTKLIWPPPRFNKQDIQIPPEFKPN